MEITLSIELTPEFVFEVWDSIRQDIPEKNREMVAKDLLMMLEESGAIDEDDMRQIKLMDKDLKKAVDGIYIEDEIEEMYDDESDWDEEN